MSLTKRKDGRYVKMITLGNGKRKAFYSSESSERKAEADIQRQLMNFTATNEGIKHNFLCTAQAMIEDRRKLVSISTITCYEAALKHLYPLYNYKIEDITPAMLQNLINEMANQKMSQSALSKVKIVFGLTLNYAIIKGINVTYFMSSIKIPKTAVKGKIHAIDDNDIATITKNAQIEKYGMWAMILLYTGMRRGELAAIQRKDIDFDSECIRVWRSVEFVQNQAILKNMPKTANGIRTIPILKILEAPLKEMCAKLEDNDFIFGKEKPLSETAIKKRWKSYCKHLNLNIHQHQLRHSYAKILYRAGVDAKTAQGLLGHADIQTTMNIYTDFSEDVTKKSASLINRFIDVSM